jgi:hypothetical protein
MWRLVDEEKRLGSIGWYIGVDRSYVRKGRELSRGTRRMSCLM